jgi:HD superfamily phosphodiesterase
MILLYLLLIITTCIAYPLTINRMDQHLSVPKEFSVFLTECMSSFKCSAHDASHVHRVANLAIRLADTEVGARKNIVYVAALCHDILDSKLISSADSVGMEQRLKDQLSTFLKQEDSDEVLHIVKSVGYKKMLSKDFDPVIMSVEYRCVQDADLLDAIGAVGIGRCFSFGGGKIAAITSALTYCSVY